VQAFAYIGSARGSANAVAQAELLANAEKELSKAIKLYPNYAEAILNRGVVYMAMHKLNKAEVDLDLAKKLDPNNANVHYNLVCLYAKTKRFDLAIDSLDSALSLGFDDYDTLRSDVDLKVLRKTKEFVKTCEKHKVFIK
jgi:tetratricopeptide (TPR) repeat protein